MSRTLIVNPLRVWSAVMLCLAIGQGSREARAGELRGRVVDGATGEPLAARVYVESLESGEWHTLETASASGQAVAYDKRNGPAVEVHTSLSAHPFRADLPAGRYRLTAERGHEYLPATAEVLVGEGGADAVLALRRWIDLAGLGWYSGETHVHRTLDELPTLLLAEDLNVALPLTQWVTVSHTPPAAGERSGFVGGSDATIAPRLIVVDRTHVIWPLNTEYEIFTTTGRRHTLGAFFVLNHREPLPMGVPPVGPVGREARRQGALIEFDKHNWPWSMMLPPVLGVDLFELTNNHLWRAEFAFRTWYPEYVGRSMGIETGAEGYDESGWIHFGFETYYALLNCGYRLRPTGGTASGVHPVPLGFGRVYVRLPDGFSYDGWMSGLNAGRSFVTTGPMLDVRFNGDDAGAVIVSASDEKVRVTVSGTASSAVGLDRIEVVVNGLVVETIRPVNVLRPMGGSDSAIDTGVEMEGSGWVAVRCWEKRGERWRFAHSAPVHVEAPGKPLKPREEQVRYLIGRVEAEIDRNRGVLSEEELEEYRRAAGAYRALLVE